MNYLAISFIIIFYIFFFARAYILKRKIGKSIKAKDPILNISILFAGASSFIFILHKTTSTFDNYLLVLDRSSIYEIIGTIMIFIGLIFSTIASLGLGNSWRVGVDDNEKTSLVTSGIYGISRNPYFTSYDIVLLGLILASLSLLVLITSAVTIILFHVLILKEEKYLEAKHGNDYSLYKKTVRRYL